jgi:hypothetical protein
MPNYPQLLARPFAQSGDYASIPETGAGLGRASMSQGFPVETQKPLNQGGVAPNRTDFNGILNRITAFLYYMQSGGQWTWNSALDYSVPCIVYYNSKLWWCLQNNGASSTIVQPGTDANYWCDLFEYFAGQQGVVTDSSLRGDGTPGDPLGAAWRGVAHDSTLTGDGNAIPLSVASSTQATMPFSAVYDRSGARNVGSIYTNNTGKPMFVSVVFSMAPVRMGNVRLMVNGATITALTNSATQFRSFPFSLTAVVPPGATYAFITDYAPNAPQIMHWNEIY